MYLHFIASIGVDVQVWLPVGALADLMVLMGFVGSMSANVYIIGRCLGAWAFGEIRVFLLALADPARGP